MINVEFLLESRVPARSREDPAAQAHISPAALVNAGESSSLKRNQLHVSKSYTIAPPSLKSLSASSAEILPNDLKSTSRRLGFIGKKSTRCHGHYYEAAFVPTPLEHCASLCQNDPRCAAFSMQSPRASPNIGCFLYDSTVNCESELWWSAGIRGLISCFDLLFFFFFSEILYFLVYVFQRCL